jgi:hypothetical protein
MDRLPSYHPCGNIDCPYNGRGGPCWGQTRIVDSTDTESQHIDTYACEGHVQVAMYGFAEYYINEQI